ncbi:MAG: MBL fold metallo-hydrolase [Dysgonamonadaceae bacterium]|jgi:ribonuclease J|nr:MBL fold metallo-hydrolase [Dysgonamonadaceae bacterium]
MKITIHRGYNQIGGCITEIATATTKILIDLGHNLPKGNQPSDDKFANEEAIKELTNGVNAIFYTHYHGDHVDLFKYVPAGVEQYIGETAKQVMLCKYEILSKSDKVENVTPADLEKLKSFKTFHVKQKITKGDITVTPYFVSHSACDAFMFLIEAGGKRILHTGDFREHGYLGKGLIPTIKKYISQQPVDALITEGTMLSRLNEKVLRETDIQQAATALMKQYKYVFARCSSTDIDRLASFCQASKATGRSFLCDDYQKKVLDIFTKSAGTKSDVYKFDDVYYYKHGHQNQFALIQNIGFCMLVRSKHFDRVKELLEQLPAEQTLLIYSMWSGYIKEGENQKSDYAELYNLSEHKKELHTSGHASPETLAKVCNLVNPTTAIIPIHSEHSETFAELDISEDLKGKVTTEDIIKI